MSVLTFSADDLFTVRVIKHHDANPDRQWANSYEFRATVGGDTGDLLTLATSVVSFEQFMHRTFVVFDRVIVSTWEPDSVPYDPAAFLSSPLTAVGQIGVGADACALNVAVNIARQAVTGRYGHLFYRGYLTEDQVSAPAGVPMLTNRALIQTTIDEALVTSNLEAYTGLTPTANFGMVLIDKTGTQVRAVSQLRASGVTVLPVDHAWFNRRSAP